MKRLLLLAFSCFLLLNNSVFAQTGGKFDTTFGKNGFIELATLPSEVGFPTKRMDTDASGRTVTVVDFYDEVLDEFFIKVTRFDASGKLDKTFGENNSGEAFIEFNGSESFFMSMALQADGKILVSAIGEGSSQNNFSIHLYRFTTKGELDQTFGTDGFALIEDADLSAAALAIQPLADGNILLGGVVGDALEGTFFAMVCKVNNKGELIKTFGELGFFKNSGVSPSALSLQFITDIAVTTNGSIVISGFFTDEDEELREGLIARLTPAGKLDPSFASTGIKQIKGFTSDVLATVVGIDVQKDGKIIALTTTFDGVSVENELIRFNVNGSTDLAFAAQGKTSVNYDEADLTFAIDLKILANNQIVTAVQGYNLTSEVFYSAVNRYSSSGVLDKKFGNFGTSIVEIDSIEGTTGNLAIAPNNNIIVMLEGEEVVSGDNYYQYFYRLLNPDVVGVKDEVVVLENVKIAPNPTFNTFTLSYNLEKNQNDVNIDLIDLEGRLVKKFTNNETRQEGRNQEILDVSSIVSGIYFLKIQTAEQVKQLKVVKI